LPTTFAELEAYSKLPEGTPNAADIYMKAFASYKPLPDAEKQKLLPVMGDQADPNGNEPYPKEQIDVAAEFVELNKEMFALLHEAGQAKDCYYPMDYSQGPFPPNDLLQNIKKACQSIDIAVIYYSQTNQPQKAYDAVMDQLHLGQSLSGSPSLINHLVRMAIFSVGVSRIQGIIHWTSLDESDLQQLQNYLQQINNMIKIGPALVGEICFCLEYKNLTQAGSANVLSVDAKATQYAVFLVPHDVIKLIKAYQRMMQIDKLPIQEQVLQVREIAKEAEKGNFLFSPSKTVLPSVGKVYEIHLRVRANMDCAITALAIEGYRLKEGKLPETVDELVPGYLPQVYLDPFDGKPLRYKRVEPGYMVYTIGADGVDDGGRDQDSAKKGETSDWVFRVYR
jgi:hypothetical protein